MKALHCSTLEFIQWDVIHILSHDSISNSPDLDEVIFGRATYHPGLIHVPAEIGEIISMTPMHE
jgi:hypothetical protein